VNGVAVANPVRGRDRLDREKGERAKA